MKPIIIAPAMGKLEIWVRVQGRYLKSQKEDYIEFTDDRILVNRKKAFYCGNLRTG